MPKPRLLALLFVAALALDAGCAKSGGGGTSSFSGRSSSTSGGGSGGGTGGGTSSATGAASSLPAGTSFAIASPKRGDFLSGSAQITVTGASAANVAKVEVNGQAATISSGSWSIAETLEFGINTFVVRASDAAGADVGHTSFSVMWSPSYASPTQDVADGLALRVSQGALNKIVPVAVQTLGSSGALQAAIQQAASTAGGGAFQIKSLTFGTPTVALTLVQGGIDASIDIPTLSVDIDAFGMSIPFTATNAHFDATLDVAVVNKAFVVTMPSAPTVQLTGFSSSNPLASTLQPAIEAALALAIQQVLPPAATAAMNGAVKPYTATYGPFTATVDAKPSTLAIDPANLRGTADANVTVAVAGATPMTTAPGAPSRNGATTAPPAFASAHDVSLGVREDLLNRGLFAAWQSGGMKLHVDQAYLAKLGVSLPFPLDASFLVPFFPALASLGSGPLPLAFELDPQLPGMVLTSGTPSLLTAELGELHMGIAVDTSSGSVPVLELAVHGKFGVTPAISGGALHVSLGAPTELEADLLANPLGLSAPDVDRFLQTALPLLVNLAGSNIPSIPLPALPGGFQPTNVTIGVDGAGADFLTVEGDL